MPKDKKKKTDDSDNESDNEKSKKKSKKEKKTKKGKSEEPTELEAIDEKIIENLSVIKAKVDENKKLQKLMFKMSKKKSKEKRKIKSDPITLPKPVAKLLGEKKLTKNEVNKKIWEYAKENDITVKNEGKTNICADKKLAEALTSDGFKVKKGQELKLGDISKILSKNGLFAGMEKEKDKKKKKNDTDDD